MLKSRTLSVSIDFIPARVYDYVSNPENLPEWAKSLALSVRKTESGWKVGTPQGPVSFRFAVKNTFGVLDHCITPLRGPEVLVPMRVVSNNYGSEVLLTLFQNPGVTDAEFAKDAKLVGQDLERLKNILEKVPAAALSLNKA